MNLVWPPTPQQKFGATAIGVLLVIIFIWLWISAGQREAANLAIAEEKERVAKEKEAEISALLEQTKKAQEEARAEREKNDADRAIWAEQQAALTRSVLARNQASDRAIAATLAPKPIQEVADEAKTILGPTAPVVQDGSFRLTSEQMQQFLAMKIDRDRLAENVKETLNQLEIERKATATLRLDLDRAIKAIDDANQRTEDQRLLKEDWIKVAESYRKVAKKGFWRKTGEISGRVGLAFGAALIAAKVAQ